MNTVAIILVFKFYFLLCYCVHMIPERASVEYYDKEYLSDIKFNVRRYGRKSGYFVNVEATTKHTWGDNISLDIVFYEYLHNEYKRTFLEFHFDHLCKMINSDPLIGKAIFNAGNTYCPLPPKHYNLGNISIPFENFPYLWPFEKAKGETTILCNKTIIAKATLYMRFTQK